MTATLLEQAYRATYADWLTYPDDGRLYEIVDGELFVTPPPSIEHQRLSRDLQYRLMQYLQATTAGEVFYAPIGVKLAEDLILEPDLALVLHAHADRIGVQVIEGPPDLVVEVLSPGTARRDLGPKRSAYESAGVPEYWIVDPVGERLEVLVRVEGRYTTRALLGRDDDLTSPTLPGFVLPLAELFVHRPR